MAQLTTVWIFQKQNPGSMVLRIDNLPHPNEWWYSELITYWLEFIRHRLLTNWWLIGARLNLFHKPDSRSMKLPLSYLKLLLKLGVYKIHASTLKTIKLQKNTMNNYLKKGIDVSRNSAAGRSTPKVQVENPTVPL